MRIGGFAVDFVMFDPSVNDWLGLKSKDSSAAALLVTQWLFILPLDRPAVKD